MADQRILRVTVRGRFDDPDDRTLGYLRSNLDHHDVAHSAYTAEGTLTYDSRIDFFSLRYEIRVGAHEPDEAAAERAIGEAGQFLQVMGFPHRSLGASVTDPVTAWGTGTHGRALGHHVAPPPPSASEAGSMGG